MYRLFPFTFLALLSTTLPVHALPLDKASFSWPWSIPFVGLLLTIATGPLLFPKIWHAHYGKISALWSAMVVGPIALVYSPAAAAEVLIHALIGEYLSFIVLLAALYVVAGGILVEGRIHGTPAMNTIMLATGMSLASFFGTTGASMVLIRPILRANAMRRHKVHVVVFFIVLVANIGGALTPLGDPPLFVGFLRGVDFFWPFMNLWQQTLIVACSLLVVFFAVDLFMYRRESTKIDPQTERFQISIRGKINIALMALIATVVLLSAVWKPGFSMSIAGTHIELQNAVRDIALVVIALSSLWLTPDEHRVSNDFNWEPIREVAKLFAAIFVVIAPVLAMLQAGRDGPFAFLLTSLLAGDGQPREAVYFWLTGILSAFLDNAPTYLVFFELAGGNSAQLMGPRAGTLAAISMGAVFMGALTYIGNAPNLMVYAIAQDHGIKMPSFFAYFLYASLILFPLFFLLTLLPIAPILNVN